MDATAAMHEIRRLALQWRIEVVGHARQRLRERGADRGDVRNALMGCTKCTASDDGPGRWKVWGEDLDGDELRVIVVIEADAVVVTLF